MSASKPAIETDVGFARTRQAMREVFSNELLLELILQKAIPFNTGLGPMDESNSNTANFRLVAKSWLNTVTKLHRQSQFPLFHLQLTQGNITPQLGITNAEDLEEEMKFRGSLLQQFTSCMNYWGWMEPDQTLPPFQLELSPTFFKNANGHIYENLFQFFQDHARNSMTHFTFNFHRSQFRHIPSSFPDFTLANLRHIELTIERMAWSFIPLIQKLLSSAPNMEVLDFTSSTCIVTHSANHLAAAVDAIASRRPYTLQLPAKTRKVLLYGTADACSCFYKVPFDNLPKLDTLALCASSCIQSQVDEIFRALAGQLVHLQLIGYKSCLFLFGSGFEINLPRLPLLESLTVALPWEANLSQWSGYDTHLPSLKELTLVHNDDQMIEAFCTKNKVLSLEKLTIIPISPYLYEADITCRDSLRLKTNKCELIHSIQSFFPNLAHLGVTVTGQHVATLEHIIDNMLTLKSLALYVEASDKFDMALNWDSFFTGLNKFACEAMVDNDNPGYWSTINLVDDEKFPSIRKLKDLQALYIIEVTYPSCPAFADDREVWEGSVFDHHNVCDFKTNTSPKDRKYLFSELSFYFSFMRMDKLKTLVLSKGFLPPKHVQEKWFQKKGRKIRCLKSPKVQHIVTAKFSLSDETWFYD